jgi:hypothetical protein
MNIVARGITAVRTTTRMPNSKEKVVLLLITGMVATVMAGVGHILSIMLSQGPDLPPASDQS